MSKLIVYKDTNEYKLGDIVEGHIDKEGNVFIYEERYTHSSLDKEYGIFLAQYFSIQYDSLYPVMELAKWREQQINKILDDDNNSGQ